MFRGVNGIHVDAKGRMVMPTRYRDRLQLESEGHIVMTIDTEERCLLLYPLPAWEEIENKLITTPELFTEWFKLCYKYAFQYYNQK